MAVDLDTYEGLGDLDAPFVLTAKAERRQRDRERLRESMRCDVAPLSFEEYSAGQPCPGCGRPYIDAEPFENKGTMYFTDEERARYEAEETQFKAIHGACGSIQHGVSGSLTTHCGKCCPMPPWSPERQERIATLMMGMTPNPPTEMMNWRLRLYCGHTVECSRHYSHKTVHSAFTGSVKCTECGRDPATIIDARAVGLVAQPPEPLALPPT
ncbi:hypothetical protein, partial [Mycobacteroides abscessus]|uniref:hypothetical protein n=1 Tax=Mycobacteroides abscessus TaxID=36809 RepID=UPI001A985889